MTHSELAEDIRRVAKAEGLTPAELTRAKYWEATGKKPKQSTQHWGEAKAEAVEDALPLPAIPPGHIVKGVSTLVGKDGRTKQQWTKTAREAIPFAAIVKVMKEKISKEVQPREEIIPAPDMMGGDRLINVVPIGDSHFGMRVHEGHTGRGWSLAESVHTHRRCITDLINKAPAADTCLLINLGDALHVDGPSNTTTKGTPQEADGPYEKMVEAALSFYVYAIDLALKSHLRVIFWTRGGNHDSQTNMCVALYLMAYYRNEPRVKFGNYMRPADYLKFGNVLIGATHGDQHKALKPDKMIQTMSNDVAKKWGETVHRVVHVGHVHHDTVKEVTGGKVETHRTLIPLDHWHYDSQYRSGQSIKLITYHKRCGEVGRVTTSPEMLT